MVITEHIAIDHYRKNKREKWISYEDVAVYVAESFQEDEQLDEITEAYQKAISRDIVKKQIRNLRHCI